MVSKVEGKLSKDASPESLLQSSFPAGTLSGAPKIKALELIQKYEVNKRNFYGGAIGSYTFSGNINHAIIIRSLLAKNKVLTYQAGAGIVAKSNPSSELNEIDNKINAVRRAITNASNLAL
jgi:anthranilate synthase component 1